MFRNPMPYALQVLAYTAIFSAEAMGADAVLPMRVSIIGYNDVVRICGIADAPSWCPERLLVASANDTRKLDMAPQAAKPDRQTKMAVINQPVTEGFLVSGEAVQ